MRIILAALLVLVAGVGAGFGLTTFEFAGVQDQFRLHHAQVNASKGGPIRVAKAIVVGDAEYSFGVLSRNETREHRFEIRNEGDRTLELSLLQVSCGKCVQTEFDSEDVPPQATTSIPIRFATKKSGNKFSEYAELRTNDPENPVIRLSIVGSVTSKVRLSEVQLELDNISASETNTATFDIYAYHSPTLEVKNIEYTNSLTSDRYELEMETLDLTNSQQIPLPTAALRGTLRIKPGLPTGPIAQTIQLAVQAEELSQLKLPISGTVVSDITVVGGRNFRRDKNTLVLGQVSAEEGTEATLRLLAKGPHRDEVEMSVESVSPDDILEVKLGDRQTLGDGGVHMYTLQIKIPPGSRRAGYIGFEQGQTGQVVIRTTHPDAKLVNVYVSFATQ